MNDLLVSVIIVNYNGKVFLKNCISSLLLQSYPAMEIIFVDNGSKDGIHRICEKRISIC